jgi:hypothetical protein
MSARRAFLQCATASLHERAGDGNRLLEDI